MSLAPEVHPAIRGVKGQRAEVNHTCCAPGCISLSQEGHHLWARSYLRGQPTEWVRLPSGRVISNVVGLCRRHHDEVTGGPGGHGAHIKLVDDTLIWLDLSNDGMSLDLGALWPQPPTRGGPKKKASSVEQAQAHGHLSLDEGQTCEHCGYTRPRPRPRQPRRESALWGVVVPADSEIGAEVLDDWVSQLAVMLGFGDEPQRLTRYHVLCTALAWVIQNRTEFLGDLVEAAKA